LPKLTAVKKVILDYIPNIELKKPSSVQEPGFGGG
jgi:hypothetical protein